MVPNMVPIFVFHTSLIIRSRGVLIFNAKVTTDLANNEVSKFFLLGPRM